MSVLQQKFIVQTFQFWVDIDQASTKKEADILIMIGPEIRPPCSNLPTKLYGSFSFPGGNPLNFGDYEVVVNEFTVNKNPTYVPRGSKKELDFYFY